MRRGDTFRGMRMMMLGVVGLLLSVMACGQQGVEASAVTEENAVTVVLPGPEFLAAYGAAEDAYLIDVRTPGEQADGMLEGAIAMDYNGEGFRQNAAALDDGRPVFVYCAKGGRSAGAAEVFEELGFGRVVDLEGGYSGLALHRQR